MPLQLAYGEAQALDRVMYEEEVRREALSFEQQFHYGAGPHSTRVDYQESKGRAGLASCRVSAVPQVWLLMKGTSRRGEPSTLELSPLSRATGVLGWV